MMNYHAPAMLKETLDGLNIKPNGVYVDLTFGGGGHSRGIIERLSRGALFAFDQDKDAAANKLDDERFFLIAHNFRYLKHFMRYFEVLGIDGILADLGLSSHHLDTPERGFSFRTDGPLDMRMDTEQEINAANIVNTYNEKALADIFRDFGDIKGANRLAKVIVAARADSTIDAIGRLMSVTSKFAAPGKEFKFYAKLFQALRIEVNNELEVLKEMLEQSVQLLKPQGRLAVITYHSLEDKLVKNFFRSGKLNGVQEKDFYGNIITPFKVITKNGVTPSEEEIKENNRVRSARLRVAEKR